MKKEQELNCVQKPGTGFLKIEFDTERNGRKPTEEEKKHIKEMNECLWKLGGW